MFNTIGLIIGLWLVCSGLYMTSYKRDKNAQYNKKDLKYWIFEWFFAEGVYKLIKVFK